MLKGTDVSVFQPPEGMDWAQLGKSGFTFFYARCCEGLSFDKTHDSHLAHGQAAGLRGGSYQFGHPSMDALALADYFIQRAALKDGQLRPAIDMESLAEGPDGQKHVPPNAGSWTLSWCKRVLGATGIKPIVYASTSYWVTMVAQCPELGTFIDPARDLWLAEYHGDSDPTLLPKHAFAIWQYAGNVKCLGIPGLADLDMLSGDSLDDITISAASDNPY